ncbi:MAG: hypothetical protein IPO81_09015 [Kouleothrix sp.]|nr:hypothetical protein [Kouleothrix sp.]
MHADPHMASFMLRFVREEPLDGEPRPEGDPAEAAGWHGVIRHIQSDAERRFTRWEEAVAFIEQYIDLAQGRGA